MDSTKLPGAMMSGREQGIRMESMFKISSSDLDFLEEIAENMDKSGWELHGIVVDYEYFGVGDEICYRTAKREREVIRCLVGKLRSTVNKIRCYQ